jgi:hypothetical protein
MVVWNAGEYWYFPSIIKRNFSNSVGERGGVGVGRWWVYCLPVIELDRSINGPVRCWNLEPGIPTQKKIALVVEKWVLLIRYLSTWLYKTQDYCIGSILFPDKKTFSMIMFGKGDEVSLDFQGPTTTDI